MLLGLLGYPLEHSLSPILHNAALNDCELDGGYSLFPIRADDDQGLKNLLARVRSREIDGLNVTIPHKQRVIPLMDELTPVAQVIGAVNTIYLRENRLVGDNTDAQGFITDLNGFLGMERKREDENTRIGGQVDRETRKQGNTKWNNPKSSLVFGAGGAARAVVYALLNDGWTVSVVARRLKQAKDVARMGMRQQGNMEAGRQGNRETGKQGNTKTVTQHITPISQLNFPPSFVSGLSSFCFHPSSFILHPSEFFLSSFSLVVNATPVGMYPDINESIWPENLSFPRHAAIYDLVYNPRVTKLVGDARAAGIPATTGLGMLIEQAALSFELWTGRAPSREAMLDKVNTER